MKSLKVLACAACLLGTVSGVGLAKDVQTIGGAMVVPNNVNVVSASKANTPSFVTSFITNQEKADKAIAKTREFFESLGVSTHLKDYGLGEEAVDKIVKQLEDHGMTRLGEKGDVTPEVAREILTRAL